MESGDNKSMKNTKMYLTDTEAKAMNLPSVAEQIESHNLRMQYRRIVQSLSTRNLKIALNQAHAMKPEVVEEYRAELRNRGEK